MEKVKNYEVTLDEKCGESVIVRFSSVSGKVTELRMSPEETDELVCKILDKLEETEWSKAQCVTKKK